MAIKKAIEMGPGDKNISVKENLEDENNKGKADIFPIQVASTALGSRSLHSKKDNSTQDGFEANYPDQEEE